jgi:hypothetical protein
VSYSIRQTAEQRRLAISLQRKCDIDEIRLVEMTAHSKFTFSSESCPLAFSIDFHPDSSSIDGRMFRINIYYRVRILDREKTDIVTIKCVISAAYLMAEGFVPSEEQMAAFKEGPAIYNCWPYFRECVQTMVNKMSYPPLTLPFLWIAAERPASGKTQKGLPTSPRSSSKPSRRKVLPRLTEST